jgi:VCBS repeat-containing protein
MTHIVKPRLLLLLLFVVLLIPAMPAAADVTVGGIVNFSSLDGSAQDDDHVVNGVFTVNGNLTIQGIVNCNDSGSSSASACSMKFVVSGDVTMLTGSAVFAENRSGSGNGGNIIIQAGGNFTMQGPSGILNGAKVSSARTSSGGNDHAGDITLSAGGTTNVQAGSHISAAANNGSAGTITINGAGVITVAGVVSAGGSDTVNNTTKLTGSIFSGSPSNGGTIRITSSTHTQPALIVTADAVIASEGGDTTGTVTLEGCDVRVLGLVASISDDGTGARVVVRSGTTILVDGRDVNRPNATLGRFGVIRADSSSKKPDGTMRADLFAANDISVFGPDPALSPVFSVNANPDTNANKDVAGSIRVTSTAGGVTATGNAFSATTDNAHKGEGGSITVSSRNNATLNTATLKASGQDAGGHIQVRSHSGSLTWQLGVGDVRPVGSSSGVSAALQGTIALTYCTSISTSGTSFPTNGPPVGVFPTIAQSCSPAAPTLPAGEPVLPTCNRPPVAVNDAYTVAEGGTLNVAAPGVLTNDSDPDGDPITALLVSGPARASSFTLNANGSFNYVHDGSETTSDSFTYRASDGSATSNIATVSITVTPVNDVPVANNDNATVAEGGTINMAAPGVLANDTDPDGPNALTAILVTGPAHASSFTLNPNGSYVYVHDGSETTSDSFTYKASDGVATSNTATVSITITPVNDAPVAHNDTYSVAEGGTLNQTAPGVLGNDTDSDSPTLTAVLVSGPAHASSFTLNPNGSFTYVHDGSETVSDSFTYKANDGSLNSNVATVNITVTPVNDAPVAVNDGPYNVSEGGTLSVASPGVLTNDTDVDSPTLTAVLVSGPAHAASFTLNPNGSFTYVHDGSETLTDSFTYRANDGSLNSNVATVSITITPVNDAPTAVNDSYTVAEGGTLNQAAPGVLGNDTDPDSPTLTAILVSGPAHASSFTLNPDGSFTYLHDGSETTTDSFTYKANDGSATSNTATVAITVTPVNDAPVANNDAYTVNEGGTISPAAPGVLANDTDPDSPTLTAVLVSGPTHAASFVLNADGSFTYVHDGSETTSDVFTYRANDGSANSSVATVTITVSPVNDAPVANNDTATVAEGGTINQSAPGVLGNDTDSDSPTLTAVLVSGPAHASSFTLNPNGSFTYLHDGSETTSDGFTYQASDGVATSNTATVSITITPVNDAPVANNDSYTVAEGGTLSPAAPGVLGNDTDPDSPTLTAVLVSGPAHASSFTLNPNGSFTYVQDGSETLTDSFTYRANDGSLNSNVATVNITITPVNDAPVAVNDGPYNVLEGGTLNVASPGVLGNDTDVDSPTLTAVLVSGPAHASSFTLNPDGSFTYVHDGSETLTDSFTYRANDGSLSSNVVTVSITISPVNDAPVAVNDNYSVAEGGTLNTPAPGVLGNDTDPDSPTLTAGLVSGPAHAASFSLNADGSFTYVHDGSETTTDSFTYRASDGLANSNLATVTITVTPVNDAPVAVNDAYAVNEGGTINAVAPGVLGNDTDVDSPTLTAVLVSGPTHAASFALNANGSFTYVHDGSETTSDTFSYKASDGSAFSNIATVTITVTLVNDAPVVTAGGTLTFTEGDPATVIDNTITISDSDSPNLTGATVTISGNYASGQDVLGFTNTANITGVFNTGTGTLTLTGSDTVANYQAALRSVTYNNTSTNPSTLPRTVTWQVDDGGAVNNLSAPVTSTINVVSTNSAPQLANGSTITYTENDPATVINSVITVSDTDSPTLTGATVQITTGYNSAQDVLSFTPVGGITGSFNSGTGTLTLSGTSSVANYQSALRSVKYTNTSEDPSTATRTVTFQVDDGSATNNLSNIVSSTVNITAVNDPPTAVAFSGLPAQAGIPITYPAGKLSGSDVEAGTAVTVDPTPINVINGTVTLNANGSFTFTPLPAAAGGTASFQYRVSDNGNPAPGANSAYVTVSFSVAGPAIYFVKSTGAGNCTLGNECTLTTALAFITSSPNRIIFIDDASSHVAGPFTLNPGGSIIGQGIVAPSFDAFFGIGTPSQGTLAPRPAVNQPRPTVTNSPITLNTNSAAGGFNMSNNSGDTLIASAKSGLLVKDMDITSTAGSGTSAVHFTNSTSASTVAFGNVSTTSGDAVTIATSGATNFSFATVSSTTGKAVGISTATGAFTFTKISSNGAAKGITVNALTGAGSFTVNGTGGLCDSTHIGAGDCTGGTIQNGTLRGAEFVNAANVTLKNMFFNNATTTDGSVTGCSNSVTIGNTTCNAPVYLNGVTGGTTLDRLFVSGSTQTGINATGVNGLTLSNSEVQNVGNAPNEVAISLLNNSGTVAITGSNIHNNDASGSGMLYVENNTGTMTLNVSGSTFNKASSTSGGIFAIASLSANMTVNVQSSTFGDAIASNGLFANGVTITAGGTSTVNATITASSFRNTNGISVNSTGGAMTYAITNNTPIQNKTNGSNGITFGKTGGSGTVSGTVSGNAITKADCGSCNGMRINAFGAGTFAATVTGNSIQHVDGDGILFVSGQGSVSSNVVIQSNSISNPDNSDGFAIDAITGTQGGDNPCAVLTVGGAGSLANTVSGVWFSQSGPPNFRINIEEDLGNIKINGYTSGAIEDFISANNPSVSSGDVLIQGAVSGGSTCP